MFFHSFHPHERESFLIPQNKYTWNGFLSIIFHISNFLRRSRHFLLCMYGRIHYIKTILFSCVQHEFFHMLVRQFQSIQYMLEILAPPFNEGFYCKFPKYDFPWILFWFSWESGTRHHQLAKLNSIFAETPTFRIFCTFLPHVV